MATNNNKNKELRVFQRFFDKLLTSAAFLQLTALAVAGPIFTILIEQIIFIIMGHNWAPSEQGLQLQILREALWAAHILLGIVLIAMTAGLIKGVKFSLPGGASAEIDLDDDEAQTTTVQTVVQTTVATANSSVSSSNMDPTANT